MVKQAVGGHPLDISLVIRHRLNELGLDQRDLAVAAQVTESYISQLLAGKKTPPAPGRTDIYDKIGSFLQLPGGELSRLADLQRKEDLKKKVADPPEPLFKAFRELILRKCEAGKRLQIQDIFQKEPFGALERLITQKLLDVAKRVAKEELESEKWLQLAARLSGQEYEQMRVMILEFLDTDVFHVSAENCISFLDPLIESWDIDLETFGIEVVLNRKLALEHLKRFDFVEREPEGRFEVEPGLEEFLKDPLLSGDATDDEIEFLKSLRFKDRRPLPLYYYRILQNTRDPLHFRMSSKQT
ncbi:MAG TPA: helix-turn-helix transcriptional regulator [Bryobacteraceae bacterium]|nr:helix-turn-helix transcriptional regulator [Bryobacteraceae bacterium]